MCFNSHCVVRLLLSHCQKHFMRHFNRSWNNKCNYMCTHIMIMIKRVVYLSPFLHDVFRNLTSARSFEWLLRWNVLCLLSYSGREGQLYCTRKCKVQAWLSAVLPGLHSHVQPHGRLKNLVKLVLQQAAMEKRKTDTRNIWVSSDSSHCEFHVSPHISKHGTWRK